MAGTKKTKKGQEEVVIIEPQPGPQTMFLASAADITIYGGSAGGGKTWGLLLEPVRHIGNKGFSSVFFRRTTVQVRNPGGLWDESRNIYSYVGGESVSHVLEWNFHSGAKIKFAHLEYEDTVEEWQGSQIPLICFDELTHFTEKQFFYMLSRNRSMCGVRPYIRATCNPVPADSDEEGAWVARFITWWINQDTGYAIPERSGVLRWFVRIDDKIEWADTPEELKRTYPNLPPKSVIFISARLEDNKKLMQANPEYEGNLMALSRVQRERLRFGNWKIREKSGEVFKEEWFEIVEAAPVGIDHRAWDFAATEAGGDWTTGPLMRKTPQGEYYILDMKRFQGSPLEVENTLYNTATQDGKTVSISIPEDPGQAGKAQSQMYIRKLAGYNVKAIRRTGDKLTYARPLAAQIEAGNVKLVRGDWNKDFLREFSMFPDGQNDDQVDAVSDAFNCLSNVKSLRVRIAQ